MYICVSICDGIMVMRLHLQRVGTHGSCVRETGADRQLIIEPRGVRPYSIS